MRSKTIYPTLALAGLLLLPAWAGAQTVLIDADTRNGSFELLGGEANDLKATHWDTDPDGDVDNWSLWEEVSNNEDDSGTDLGDAATHGNRVAFLQNQNGAYNLTDWTVQEGDVFTYTWDWVNVGRDDAVAGLAYLDGGSIVEIAGSTSTNPNTTEVHTGLGATYTAMAGDPAIGNLIALTVFSPDDGYPEVDNFTLTATAVPEPSTYALIFGAVALGGVVLRRRLQKA